MYNGLKAVWDREIRGLLNIGQWIVDAGAGTLAMGKKLFGWIGDGFRWVINKLIDGWNSIEFKIPGFDPPGPGPKFGGFTLGVPDIPHLHTGGVVPGPVGAEVPIMALAGETVLPIGATSAGPLVGHLEVKGHDQPERTARQIVFELQALAVGRR
jgi:hypothetical protein